MMPTDTHEIKQAAGVCGIGWYMLATALHAANPEAGPLTDTVLDKYNEHRLRVQAEVEKMFAVLVLQERCDGSKTRLP